MSGQHEKLRNRGANGSLLVAGMLAVWGAYACVPDSRTSLGRHEGFDENGNLVTFGPDGVKTTQLIPTDTRTPARPATRPPPISGGTLLVTKDGRMAVAADPERNRISLVHVVERRLITTLELAPDSEPGRVVEDDRGRVHVALRRAGTVISIDLLSGEVVRSLEVCGAPRGLAYQEATSTLHVACADGTLVSFPIDSTVPSRSILLQADLRDVFLNDSGLWVTTFKRATMFRIAEDGTVAESSRPEPAQRTVLRENNSESGSFEKQVRFEPAVAWRTVGNGSEAIMLHQMASTESVETKPGGSLGGSPYGGAGSCDGIVSSDVSIIDQDGSVSTRSVNGPMVVDTAVSPDGQWIGLAKAGPVDPEVPFRSVMIESAGGDVGGSGGGVFRGDIGTLAVLPRTDFAQLAGENTPCEFFGATESFESDPMVAVQFSTSTGEMVALKREPAELVVARGPSPWQVVASIPLGGVSTTDTGHDLFHKDGGAGLACASCHPEGAEDGRTWIFSDVGKRRTQPLNIGLEGTAPFHWNGDLPGVSDLMREVFVLRMGGVHESSERLEALESWLFGLLPPEPIRRAEDPGAIRGREIFHSTETGCATCHSGERLTDNSTVAVRAGDPPLQVPSLIGVGYRSPFMHDGCAETLNDRFVDSCGGGPLHGRTSHLSAAQVDDLVAYLESL